MQLALLIGKASPTNDRKWYTAPFHAAQKMYHIGLFRYVVPGTYKIFICRTKMLENLPAAATRWYPTHKFRLNGLPILVWSSASFTDGDSAASLQD